MCQNVHYRFYGADATALLETLAEFSAVVSGGLTFGVLSSSIDILFFSAHNV